jgi:hypothetical protein
MPKMKDLGINVIPETMRPAECLPFSACACTYFTNPCYGCTRFITHYPCVAYTTVTLCTGGTHITIFTDPTTPQIQVSGELTHESIAQLREQLHAQIAQLDEVARNIGPKTGEEIDAREKQLKTELDDLARRRKDLKK